MSKLLIDNKGCKKEIVARNHIKISNFWSSFHMSAVQVLIFYPVYTGISDNVCIYIYIYIYIWIDMQIKKLKHRKKIR